MRVHDPFSFVSFAKTAFAVVGCLHCYYLLLFALCICAIA